MTRSPVKHDTSDWGAADQAGFFQSLLDAGNGEVKIASEGATGYTRRILRESSFTPAIMKPQPITVDDLQRLTSSAAGDSPEIGVYVCEMEPGSPGSRTVPFVAGPNQNTYRGDVYHVRVSKDETPEMYKNVDQLGLYEMDLRQVVTDNLLKDLDNWVDYRLLQTAKDITGSDVNTDGDGGYRQYREVEGGISRQTYKQTLLPLMDAQLNNGLFLMSRQTAVDFCGWGRDEIGGDLAERILNEGMNALETFKFFNVPHVASIKKNLLPKGQVFHWAPQNFLGRFVVYQEPTVYVKRERDTIYVYATHKYGYGIGNVAGVARTVFLE